MITNKGKTILAKYLIGQSPAYASHIAIGCGARPIDSLDGVFTNEQKLEFAEKTSLDFEMFRVPVISRGYVVEDGVSKIVFTAELPTEERYEISEIGVFSAGSNPTANTTDSKIMIKFSESEGWMDHGSVVQALGTSVLSGPTFISKSNNPILLQTERVARYEQSRFLNSVIGISGDYSDLEETNGVISSTTTATPHLHLTGTSFDITKNSPSDKLALAFSVADGVIGPNAGEQIKKILIRVEFLSLEADSVADKNATFDIVLTNDSENSFDENRYFVASKSISEIYQAPNFSWSDVSVVRIFATVINDDDVASPRYYVNLDGLRLENVSSENPLYGMVGYSVVKSDYARAIVKEPNTKNFVEFRFAMDVV
jgi:hypothetical protein